MRECACIVSPSTRTNSLLCLRRTNEEGANEARKRSKFSHGPSRILAETVACLYYLRNNPSTQLESRRSDTIGGPFDVSPRRCSEVIIGEIS